MPKLHFLDVTNRDGVQTARITLSKLQRTMLNAYVAEMGIRQSEFGFPFLKAERSYLEANLELQKAGVMCDMILEGWCRAIVSDVQAALQTSVRHFNLSISTSDQMIVNKFRGKLDREAVIHEMTEAAHCAREGGALTLGVNAEDASRTDLDYLTRFVQAAKDSGADRFRYCDTVGCDTPYSIYRRVRTLAEKVGIAIELHCHEDLGMSTANSIAGAMGALDGGVDAHINTTVNGVGERAGQADLVSCILAAKFGNGMEKYEIGDPINLEVAWKLANYVARAFGVPLTLNQPGVGANAFAHEAGIHADGALKDRHNYELYDFELLGRGEDERISTGRVITTGEFGGLAGFLYVYGKLGVEFADTREAQKILELVQYANAHNQLPLTDDELRLIAKYPEQVRKLLTIVP